MRIYKTNKGYYYKEILVKKKIVRKRISKKIYDKMMEKTEKTKKTKKTEKTEKTDKSKRGGITNNSTKVKKIRGKCPKQKGGTVFSTKNLIDKIFQFYTSQGVEITAPSLRLRNVDIQWDSQIQSNVKPKYSYSYYKPPYCRYCGLKTDELQKFMLKSFTGTEYKDSDVCGNCIIFLRECLYIILFKSTDYKSEYIKEPYNKDREIKEIEFLSDDDYIKVERILSGSIQQITINGFLLNIELRDRVKNVYKIIVNNHFRIIMKLTSHSLQKSYFHNYSILNDCLTENQYEFVPFNLIYSKHDSDSGRYKVCSIYEYIEPTYYNLLTKEHFITLYQQLQLMFNYGILYIDFKIENIIFGYDMNGDLKFYLIDFDDIMYRIDSHNKRKNYISGALTLTLPNHNAPLDQIMPNLKDKYDSVSTHFFNDKHIIDYIIFIKYILKSIYIGLFNKSLNENTSNITDKLRNFYVSTPGFKFVKTNLKNYEQYKSLLNDAPEELMDFELSDKIYTTKKLF